MSVVIHYASNYVNFLEVKLINHVFRISSQVDQVGLAFLEIVQVIEGCKIHCPVLRACLVEEGLELGTYA